MMGHDSHRVTPFGNLRVKALFQLTEAYRRLRVLLRLLMPRHPPAALISLTKNWSTISPYFYSLRNKFLNCV